MVTVGIDPHKDMHQAVALAQDGTRLGRAKKVNTGPQALGQLLAWIRALAANSPVLWAIEGGPGLGRALADALLGAGQEVVWVPPRAMAAHRRLGGPVGAKSDVIDAVAIARAALADPGLARHRIDPQVRQVRVLVNLRQNLTDQRVALTNRVLAAVHIELDHRLGQGALATRAKVGRVRALVEGAGLDEMVRWALLEQLEEIHTLFVRAAEVERRLKELVEPLAPNLLGIRGVGVVWAAVLLSQVGDVSRFATSARMARWAGSAPIPVFSSGRDRHRLHRGGNRQVNRALHSIGVVQVRLGEPAREFVRSREGAKGTKGAYRALKRHLVDVVYRAMVADQVVRGRAEVCLQPAT
ncbi:IS110 family RNA-guided transposase [Nocardiopsis metallicus]|uniref:Transposase n=1 Tax=Nocardiopsis metallicus TaxID=179819 RepID=A0A840WCZ7_9ACTN|nr:IS110 family transposase [Nocardiopsis metallicus]MBB5489875.1 transposase [Nocardiopsis metallicus]